MKYWSLEDKKILIVDDDASSYSLAKIYLTKMWIDKRNISFAGDGLSAIEIVKKELFDLVLMDIELPWINWVETSQTIKSRYNWNSPKLIAYTANVYFDREKVMKELFDAIIIKPVTKEKFEGKILAVLHMKDEWLAQKN